MRIVPKTCEVCGTLFQTRWNPRRERFCSKQCRGRFWNRTTYLKRHPPKDRTRVCVICQRVFTAPVFRPSALTCSQPCNSKRQDARRRELRHVFQPDGPPRPCRTCGNEFVPQKYGGKRQVHCSPECRQESAHRAAQIRNPHHRAKNNQRRKFDGNWQRAMERDGYRCQSCGTDKKLLVHHRDGSGERSQSPNHELDNLVTLCHKCHVAVHNIIYRVIGGEVYVIGKIFDLLAVGETVKVLREVSHDFGGHAR